MKIYRIIIKPTTPFGTPLKGDTIFGHFCWQAAENPSLLTGGLDKWIACYSDLPFAVFSSAWPIMYQNDTLSYAFPRPPREIPVEVGTRREKILHNKEIKKRKWLLVDSTLKIQMTENNLKSDSELFTLFADNSNQQEKTTFRHIEQSKKKICLPSTRTHNSINRLTMTTGKGEFAPFSLDNFLFIPGLRLAVFAATDETALAGKQLQEGFEQMGLWGYGRDAATGLGRFTVESVEEHFWPVAEKSVHNGCYTLGPSVPQKNTYSRCHAAPFTRFGRHGGPLAVSGKPFKAPVVMADEGAILYPKEFNVFRKPYLGTAIENISDADQRTVAQGYSLYLPC